MARRSWKALTAMLLVATLGVAACGSDDDDGGTTSASAPTAGAGGDTKLTGICPNPIVIQTNWFPQALDAPVYELIGPGGKIDGSKGRYSGPLGDTGVNVEVRSGGPFLGNQSVAALMYEDDDILLALAGQDLTIGTYGRTPMVGVFAAWENNPVSLTFDPASFDFKSIADIGKSNATILYFEGVSFVDYLVGKGMVRRDQLDGSFDGSLSRFVAEPKKTVLHTVVTNEPWRLEHEVPAWGGKPVKNLLLSSAGFDQYITYAVRANRVQESGECLKRLVPMLQQATVDYLKDPKSTNKLLIDIVTEFNSFWKLSPELNDFAYDQIVKYGFLGNGPDSTVGNFDTARVERMVGILKPIYAAKGGEAFDPNVTATQVATNEFIDPAIGPR